MAEYNAKAKSSRAVGNFNFEVSVLSERPEDTVSFRMGVDKADGLNFGTINSISYRNEGGVDAHKDKFPGLVETKPVTFQGLYLRDLGEIKDLKLWHDQCAGRSGSDFKSVYRTVLIKPALGGRNSQGVSATETEESGGFTLVNAIITDLDVSSFDDTSPDFSTWTFTVVFRECIPSIVKGA